MSFEGQWFDDVPYDNTFNEYLPDSNSRNYGKQTNASKVPVKYGDMSLNKALGIADFEDLFNSSPFCSEQSTQESQPHLVADGSSASHLTNSTPKTISDILDIQENNINREASHAILNKAFIDERESFLFETAKEGLFIDKTNTNMSTSILMACQGGFSSIGDLVWWMINKSDFDGSITTVTKLPKPSTSNTFTGDIIKITFSGYVLRRKQSYNLVYLKRIDPDRKLKEYSFERYRAGSPTFYSPVLSTRKLYDGTLEETVPMDRFELPKLTSTSKTERRPKEISPLYECVRVVPHNRDGSTKIKLRKIKPKPLRKLSTLEYLNNLNEKVRAKKRSKNLTVRERIWKQMTQ